MSLAPGETKRVTIELDDKAFRYFNVKTNCFEIEGGTYDVMVAASAEDIRLTVQVAVRGTDAPLPYEGKEFDCYRRAELENVPDSAFAALLCRPIPPHNWDEKVPLEMNDALMQLYYAKNPLARLVGRKLQGMQAKSIAAGKPDLNILFIYNMPFRGIAKMMNGMVSMEMAQSILKMANGHFLRGLGRLIKGFVTRPGLKKMEDK